MTGKKLIQLNTRVPASLKKNFDKTVRERGQAREHVVIGLLEMYVNSPDPRETETG